MNFESNLNKSNCLLKMFKDVDNHNESFKSFMELYLSYFLDSLGIPGKLNSLSDEQLSKLITCVIDIYFNGFSVKINGDMVDAAINYTNIYKNIYSTILDYVNKLLSFYNREYKGRIDYQNIVNSYFDNLPIGYKKYIIEKEDFSKIYYFVKRQIENMVINFSEKDDNFFNNLNKI